MTIEEVKSLNNDIYISSRDIYYPNALKRIKKEKKSLRPIFEAFSNALESFSNRNDKSNKICIQLYLKNNDLPSLGVTPSYSFEKFVITDNGHGFTDEDFARFLVLDDDRKSPANKGAGRMQFLHFFDITEITSYFARDSIIFERKFSISKRNEYINNSAIIKHIYTKESDKKATGTKIVFTTPLIQKDEDYFSKLDVGKLAKEIINNFILEFCKDVIPEVTVVMYVNNIENAKKVIELEDIPQERKEYDIEMSYKIKKEGIIKESDKTEHIKVSSFKIDSVNLPENKIIVTAKNEITDTEINLQCINSSTSIDNKRYMFLLSSPYFDQQVSVNRGNVELLTLSQLEKDENDLFEEEVLLLDDIEKSVNESIPTQFQEIKDKQLEMQKSITELKQMFLLNDDSINHVKITANDDDKSILRKVYAYDSNVLADNDAKMKKELEKIKFLDPTADNYSEKLESITNTLVSQIPIQNRTALTQYVARRQLILKELKYILDNQLTCQEKTTRAENEKLIHNLIFQQGSYETDKSALWLLNEDFIYFKGCSEQRLKDIQINGENIFKADISDEEEAYLTSFGENRKIKRPDILLFPEEGKCIIIELKAPDVNVSEYIPQVNKYATWILNFTEEKFHIDTFYGYLIGDNYSKEDVWSVDSDFEESYQFDYLFRPSKNVRGRDDRKGSLYMEVLTYSTLLKKAEQRNKVYKEKLGIKNT